MHIAIDARELTGQRTGVGTYLSHLLDEWAQAPEARAHRWTLYVPRDRAWPEAPGRLQAEGGRQEAAGGRRRGEGGIENTWDPAPGGLKDRREGPFERRRVGTGSGTLWEQWALASAVRQDRPDVLFAPGYTAPLAIRTPVALTIHDLSFVAHPEWFSQREGLRRRLLTRWSAHKARQILTVSEFSRQEIVARLGVPALRVHAIRHGISRPASLPAAASRRPLVLYVGSIFNRRRLPDLVRAFASLGAQLPDARLEIVGDNRTHPREDLDGLARALGAGERIRLRSYVSDEDLRWLYAQARVFAFLSEYEGFGFTPLEAIAHQVPVVVLDTPVAREIYGDAAIYVGRGDIGATATALERVLTDEALRTTLLERGRQVLARYCWPEAARLTLQVIEQAGGRG